MKCKLLLIVMMVLFVVNELFWLHVNSRHELQFEILQKMVIIERLKQDKYKKLLYLHSNLQRLKHARLNKIKRKYKNIKL